MPGDVHVEGHRPVVEHQVRPVQVRLGVVEDARLPPLGGGGRHRLPGLPHDHALRMVLEVLAAPGRVDGHLDAHLTQVRGRPDGVLCDDGCATALPQVVAVGDVARMGGARAEHWTSATEQPRVAVANLLAGRTPRTLRSVPYFWSDQYGSRIQFAGRRRDGDTVRIAEGQLTEGELTGGEPADGVQPDGGLLALYEREGRTTAVLSLDRPRPFMRARREPVREEGRVRSGAA